MATSSQPFLVLPRRMSLYVEGVDTLILTALKPMCRPSANSTAAPADATMAMTRVGQAGLHVLQLTIQLSP